MNEQRYVLVPLPAPDCMLQPLDAFMRPTAARELLGQVLETAPPPPESVLSDFELHAIWSSWEVAEGYNGLMRRVERAALKKFVGNNRGR